MSTVTDIRGRNFMKLADFTPEEITYLPDLGRAERRSARGARSKSLSARRSH